jgi:hypothetical protein
MNFIRRIFGGVAPVALPDDLPKHHPGVGRYDVRGGIEYPPYVASDGQGATEMAVVEGGQPSTGVIPFRRASTFRTSLLEQTTGAITAATQPVQIQVEGSGYVYGVDIELDLEADNSGPATVAWHEDAPWSAVDSIVYQDVNGELWNLPGISTRFLNLYGGWALADDSASTDEYVFEQVSGAVARGGSAHCHLMVPIALNHRTLMGLVGNQDKSQKYALRSNLAPSTAIYTTAPTVLPVVQIDRTYLNYAVPGAVNADGVQQQRQPDYFGVLHFGTQTVSPAVPTQGTRNHFLPRIGNTLRTIILVFRDGNGTAARADAEANMPTLIKFMLGDTPVFAETVGARRKIMRDRYGFDAPNGVLVYDWITDLTQRAGAELGDDYLWTQGLNNAQFEVTYPAGWAANSSLTIITDDLIVPKGMNIYQ